MLCKENIFALFSLLVITSALDATLEKSVFYVASINYLSYDMFQTSQGIIAHSTPNYTGIPMQDEYQLINLKTHSVTQVLSDIVTACGQDAFQFNKLHYHAATATLVYYCLVNNSLLILDEQDWTVQSTIATNIVANFSEVKIVTDGYSIAIIGMGPLNSTSVLPSQFIKVDLQSRQIVNNMTFDHDFKPGERVTGYASNGNNRYIVTNTIGDSSNNVTVYSMKIIANSYSITLLASISEEYNTVVTLLYCVGDLIVTNSQYNVVVISDAGNILGTIKDVSFSGVRLPNHIAFTSEPGSNEFYTQLRNGTFLRSTFKKSGYITENIGDYVGDFKLVFGSPTGNTMLMTNGFWGNFTITDTKTSKIVYTMITGDVGFLTDSTYILEESDTLYFFSRETDAFLQTIDINELSYLFEPENNLISYLSSADDGKCQLVQIDLNTRTVTVALSFQNTYSDYPCPGELINVTNNEHGVQAVFENLDSYYIISQAFGMINFTIPNEDYDPHSVSVDYSTLEVYYFVSGAEKSEIRSYEYDSNSKNLSLKTTTNMSLNNGRIFYTEANQVLVFAKGGYMDLIKLPSLEQRTYMMDSPYNQISGFKDKSGKTYTILTSFIEDTPEIFYDDEFHLLPGGTDATLDGGAAGQCAYWVFDQVDNFELIRFYDICASKKNEKIDA